MAQISVLSKEISELIAAGEVIERPASVIKEVVENAIDADARHITVEIKRGGTTYMRITDDGCGMHPEDVPTAFLRHATSKISVKDDLDSIYTLGFRGEALASISAVAKVSLLTKRRENPYGTRYDINGSVPEGEPEQTGCPDGTTIIIRDLFYNVPVRQRFMKKDVSEANAVSQIVQKIALSHPGIAFQMIRDNRLEFCTDGSGDLYAAIYAIYGKEFAHDMVPVEYDDGYIHIEGYTCKPLYAKSSRSFQNFFINGRYVRSRVCSSAVENAYENLIMTGKFPSCVLTLSMNASDLDVNVHPTKAEVRFTNEKSVTDGLYFGIKNALMQSGLIYEFQIQRPKAITDWTAPIPEEPVYTQPVIPEMRFNEKPMKEPFSSFEDEIESQETSVCGSPVSIVSPVPQARPSEPEVREQIYVDIPDKHESAPEPYEMYSSEPLQPAYEYHAYEQKPSEESASVRSAETAEQSLVIQDEPEPEASPEHIQERAEVKFVGELFRNYIIAEADGKMLIVDKHAAHERVLFEKLRAGEMEHSRQLLMTPVRVLLGADESEALLNNSEITRKMGFSFGFEVLPYVNITGIPTFAQELDLEELVTEIAGNLVLGKSNPNPEYLDDTLHTIACKAAIKANDRNDPAELQKLAEEVYNDERIRHCPHGRPVMFVLSKYELEKQFRRV